VNGRISDTDPVPIVAQRDIKSVSQIRYISVQAATTILHQRYLNCPNNNC